MHTSKKKHPYRQEGEVAPIRRSRLRRPSATAKLSQQQQQQPETSTAAESQQQLLLPNNNVSGNSTSGGTSLSSPESTTMMSSSNGATGVGRRRTRQQQPSQGGSSGATGNNNSTLQKKAATTAPKRKKSAITSIRSRTLGGGFKIATAMCLVLTVLWALSLLVFLRHLDSSSAANRQGKEHDGVSSLLRGGNIRFHQIMTKGEDIFFSLRGSGSGGTAAAEQFNIDRQDGTSNRFGYPPASSEEIVDMRQLNRELKFDNPDGGAWKQGWDVRPRELPSVSGGGGDDKKNTNRLRVFVVPHSHCDPGWIKTFDAYFKQQVIEIISSVVGALLQDKRRTFIWAEISYFSWWWKERAADDLQLQQQVKQLLDNGQLEFVTGGWVQPDEANSELYAMEIQLQEGRDWILETLGEKYLPKYGWSIDPFGYSPTMAWLLNKYGYKAMLIQRVHYAVKKELAKRKHLEFYWRQTWDKSADTGAGTSHHRAKHDIFAHVMPFFSYDVPHTCGPDPLVCCQFDFHRSPVGTGPGCPWGKPPQVITDSNVKERALLALDQYRKKAALYRSNVVLIPLGDDFRYQTPREALAQYENHQKIHDYINANVEGVSIQFGTLSQYFDATIDSFSNAAQGPVPVLKGSFFTYADVNEDYWSGYFTSRAFDKALDRQLERALYAAESIVGDGSGDEKAAAVAKLELREPRRELSLFQHHDGITGTAKDHVVEDYAQRMHSSIQFSQKWLLERLRKAFPQETAAIVGKGDSIEPCWASSAPRDLTHNLCAEGRPGYDTDVGGNAIEGGGGAADSVVVYNPLDTPQSCGIVTVPPKQLKVADLPCEVPGTSSGSSTKLVFDPVTGLMQEPFKEEWMVWKVRKGGAYLFFPGELLSFDLAGQEKVTIEQGGYIVKTENWKRTIIEKQIPTEFGDKATTIDFIYEVNLDRPNQEWFVRFSSSGDNNIRNDGVFHTDLNGFNFDTHKFRKDMPIQSQVFPMPTLASIEDKDSRMTVMSEHAQGTASLSEGSIDVWLDRRLSQDDARGLGQGVQDNRPLRTRLRLVLEKEGYSPESEFTITKLTRRMWLELQHPLEMFGPRRARLSPADPSNLKKAEDRRAALRREMRIRKAGGGGDGHRALNETDHPNGVFSFFGVSRALRHLLKYTRQTWLGGRSNSRRQNLGQHTVDNTVVPFVYMVYKRVDYLKKSVDSLRRSDFPRHRVPLIISHDGRVPEVVEFVDSLKKEFNVVQLFHPYSCYEHPHSFPGNDTSLNEGYKGDAYGNPREAWVTCCKHHFTWILRTVFGSSDDELGLTDSGALSAHRQRQQSTDDDVNAEAKESLDDLSSSMVDTFLFMEEDYVVAPTVYGAIIEGLNVIELNDHKTSNGIGFLGVGLDPTEGNAVHEPTYMDSDTWFVSAFRTGPMTMNRRAFAQLQRHAQDYCRFDEYNWDWTMVHLAGQRYIPHTLLMPSRTLAKHIGVTQGMHNNLNAVGGEGDFGPDFEKLETKFHGKNGLYQYQANIGPLRHDKGYGGWGHPVDQQHCLELLSVRNR